MKQKVKLYNVIFPFWLLIFLPSVWLIVLPGNLLIDFLVLFVFWRQQQVENKKALLMRSVWIVWIFGFLADLLGSLFLFLLQMLPLGEGFRDILADVSYNPFASFPAFLIVLLGILLSAVFIYLFNRFFSFRKLPLSDGMKKKTALVLAVFTAPYLFLLPTSLFYGGM